MSGARDKYWWRQYRIDKRDAINARLRSWNKAKRDKRNAIQRRYRAKLRAQACEKTKSQSTEGSTACAGENANTGTAAATGTSRSTTAPVASDSDAALATRLGCDATTPKAGPTAMCDLQLEHIPAHDQPGPPGQQRETPVKASRSRNMRWPDTAP